MPLSLPLSLLLRLLLSLSLLVRIIHQGVTGAAQVPMNPG